MEEQFNRREPLPVLAQVTRSGEMESVHRGCIAVVDATGRLLAQVGDAELPVFWRSAAKLHQAIPLLLHGGKERWAFSSTELAILCSSHHGLPEQVAEVRSILEKIRLGPDALRCGTQEPSGRAAACELVRRGEQPGPLHNQCSGNHAGLLALAQLLGVDPATYCELHTPVQQSALALVAQFAGLDAASVKTGVDGCGIPTYRTPLRELAVAFARLKNLPLEWAPELRSATTTLVQAVTRHPEFIGGAGNLDTECIRAFGGACVCKLGAEGICAAAFDPSPAFPSGVGIAIKIEDGTGDRARSVALAGVLHQLRLGTPAERERLDLNVDRTMKTRAGATVGEIRPAFRLKHAAG